MNPDDVAELPDAPLVILATDDSTICIDELCLPADAQSKVEPPAPEADA